MWLCILELSIRQHVNGFANNGCQEGTRVLPFLYSEESQLMAYIMQLDKLHKVATQKFHSEYSIYIDT